MYLNVGLLFENSNAENTSLLCLAFEFSFVWSELKRKDVCFMAENKKPSSGKTQSRNTSASNKNTARVTNYSKNAQPEKKSAPEKKNGKKGKNVHQFIPYILIAIGLFLLICYVTNLICNWGNELNDGSEGEHIMGYVGFYVCEVTLGLFGWAAFFIPPVLIFLALFWKKYIQDELAGVKTVVAVITTVILSGFIHILIHAGDRGDLSNQFVELYEEGAELIGGGVVGGYLAFALNFFANIAGSIFICIALLIPLVLYLVGATPQVIIDKVSALVKKRMAEAKEEREAEDKEEKARLKAEKQEERERKKQEKEAARAEREAMRAEREAMREAERAERNSEKENAEETEEAQESAEPSDIPEKIAHAAVGRRFSDDISDSDEKLDTSSIFDDEEPQIDDDGTLFVCDEDFEDDGEYDESDEDVKVGGFKVDEDTGEVLLVDDDEELIMPDDDGEENVEENSEESAEDSAPAATEYVFPPVDLLEKGSAKYSTSQEEIDHNIQALRDVLESFKIKVKEVSCSCGPTITRFEVKPEAGVRVRQIANLVDDISLALAKSGVRIEAPIPGKAAVGIEVPNDTSSTVFLRNLIEAPEFQNHKSKLAACLGADVSGRPIVFDIEKMPHLLVAGTTGSGKSVCINSIITSILYKARPDEVKLVLVDPKKIEFAPYRDIPHLSCKIVTDPKKAAGALNSAVNEMEKRFELIERTGVRNIAGYNEITKNDPDMPYMPRMVIIIDELADLMMSAPDDVETSICRIAQKARAAGIHLILGTQRPSVDVITGLIKANIPSRIAFTVSSQVDSRTIIDVAGAEKLIGKGDMLFVPVGALKPQRVQGTFVSDGELERVVDFVKANNPPVRYDQDFERSIDEEAAKCGNQKGGSGAIEDIGGDGEDAKFYEAVEVAIDAGKISTSLLQRRLSIGYGKAAKIIDRMEELGFVSEADGNKPRKILVTRQELAERMMNSDGE